MSSNENRERAQRLKLPTTVVAKIVKNALPENAKISGETKCVVSRAASVFVLNMATFATDHAQGKKRKMVQAEDVIAALKGLECERLEQKISSMVEAWKQKRAEKNADAAKKRADKRAANSATSAVSQTDVAAASQPLESQVTEISSTKHNKERESMVNDDINMVSQTDGDEDVGNGSSLPINDLPEAVSF